MIEVDDDDFDERFGEGFVEELLLGDEFEGERIIGDVDIFLL